MSEGDPPEIPQHLLESVPSVAAYEQQERRAFRIDDYARKLQIPKESMAGNETVRRYMTLLRDADAARERLGRFEQMGPVIDPESPLRARTSAAARLYAVEKMILEEGFQHVMDGGKTLPPRRIRLDPMAKSSLPRILDRAGRPYGVSVAVSPAWQEQWERDYAVSAEPLPPLPVVANGAWAGAPFTTDGEEPWKRDGERSEWYWPDWPNERRDPEHLRALATEARWQGIAADRPAVDPAMHTLLSGIVYGRQLVAQTEALASLPAAPGMAPSAQERLAQVAPLNRLAVSVLEDALRPGSLMAERFAAELAPLVHRFDLVVTR